MSSSPAPLIEENIFSPFYILALFAEGKVPVGTWVISGLSILLLWPILLLLCQYYIVFMTIAMQYSLKSGRFIPPTPFFFFKIALAIWSLHFHRVSGGRGHLYTYGKFMFSSVHISRSVMSDSLLPHESQHSSPPCPSPTPRVYSNSCPSSQWWHPAISSSVAPFSSCPQPLPASGYFPMSQLFSWGGQSIGVSASASVLPMNTQDWSPLGWTGWISLQLFTINSYDPLYFSVVSCNLSFLISNFDCILLIFFFLKSLANSLSILSS